MDKQNFSTKQLDNETWKPVVGYESQYLVSSLGRVKGIKRDKVLKPFMQYGYPRVVLCKQGSSKNHLSHRLVAFAFIGQPPEGQNQINHIDGNPANPSVENLEWCSPSENSWHRINILKTHARGEKAHHAKLKDSDIPAIRKMCCEGIHPLEIAQRYKISRRLVDKIHKRENYAHVSG